MSDFIDELLIVNIVSRLPIESVLQCRCVCKRWRDLLHELHFTQIHTLQQQKQKRQEILSFFMFVKIPKTNNYEFHLQDFYVNYANEEHDAAAAAASSDVISFPPSSSHKVSRPLHPPVQLITDTNDDDEGKGNSSLQWYILGSVNGLICLYAFYSSRNNLSIAPIIIIYNPITREYLNVPSDDESLCVNHGRRLAFGFGYHPSKNEYKIVRIIHQGTIKKGLVRWVQIYTLGSGKWRIKKEEKTGFYGFYYFESKGVPFNGAIYWLASGKRIVSFDMEDEKFRVIPSPPMSTGISYQLRVLAEHLCLIEQNTTTNIWVMNNNDNTNNFNNNAYSKFRMPSTPIWRSVRKECTIVAVTRRGRILCLHSRGSLISFDHRTESHESLGHIPLFETGSCHIVSYTKSLVSLKALGEEDAEIIKQQHATQMKRTNPTTTTKSRRRSIDMKTEMIKLFTSLLLNVYVD